MIALLQKLKVLVNLELRHGNFVSRTLLCSLIGPYRGILFVVKSFRRGRRLKESKHFYLGPIGGFEILYSDIYLSRPFRKDFLELVTNSGLRASSISGLHGARRLKGPTENPVRDGRFATKLPKDSLPPSEVFRLSKWLKELYPDIGPLLAVFLIVRYQLMIERALRSEDLKLIVAWHQFNPFHYILDRQALRCRIPVCWMETGVIPGTIHIDMEGQMGLSWPSQFPEVFKKIPITASEIEKTNRFIEKISQARLSNKPQVPLTNRGIENGARVSPIVLFLGSCDPASQLRYPSQGVNPDGYLDSSESTIKALSEVCGLLGLELVAKAHPLFPKERYRGTDLGTNWFEEEVGVWDLIELAHTVVTNVSGSASVALALGKNVIVSDMHPFAKIAPVSVFSTKQDLIKIFSEGLDCKDRKDNDILEFMARHLKYQPFLSADTVELGILRSHFELITLILDELKSGSFSPESLASKVTPGLLLPRKNIYTS